MATSVAARQTAQISSVISTGVVIAGLLASIILYDLFVYFFNVAIPRQTVFLVALAIVMGRIAVLLIEPRTGDERFMAWIAIILFIYQVLNLFIAIMTTGEPTRSLYFTAPIVALYLVVECNRIFRLSLIAILCVNVAVELYEISSAEYLFFSEDRTWVGVFYYEFLGEFGVFRAKGLFPGPLTAAYLSLCIAMIFRRNTTILAICLVGAAAASGRGAMLWIAVLLLVGLVRDFRRAGSSGQWLWSGLVVLGTLYALVSTIVDEAYLDRLHSIFSLSENSNSARLEYWSAAWQLFWYNDSFFDALFGTPNLFRVEFDSSTENDYLQILLDYGLIGLCLFFTALIWTILRLRSSSSDRLFVLCLVGFMMFIAPPLASMTNSVLFWFFLFGEFSGAGQREAEQSGLPSFRLSKLYCRQSRSQRDVFGANQESRTSTWTHN